MCKKQVCQFSWDYVINYMEKIREKMKNRSHIYDISTKPRHGY